MTTTTPTAVQEKEDALFDAVGDASIPDVTVGFQEHPLTKAAAAQGLTYYFGRIAMAGSFPTGRKWVQLNVDGGGGVGGDWPDWAYEIARDALLNNIKVWVISDGDPVGLHIIQVMLLSG